MTKQTHHASQYECVDPNLGARLWQYNTPGCSPELQRRLDNHIDICHGCRLALAIQDRLEVGLQSGKLGFDDCPAKENRPLVKLFVWSALVTAIAAVLLVFLLPPRSLEDPLIIRGEQVTPGFVRPVAGEVIWKNLPEISWTVVEFATTYQIRIEEIGGSFEWSGETSEPHLVLPAEIKLPADTSFRVLLETVPAYLVPPEGIALSFRSGGLVTFLFYRVVAAPVWLQGSVVLGLLFCLSAFAYSRRSRR